MRLHTLIRDKLEHRHIHGIGPHCGAVLCRSCHTVRKLRHEPHAVIAFQYLRAILGDMPFNANIENLASLNADITIMTAWQAALIDGNVVDLIGFIDG